MAALILLVAGLTRPTGIALTPLLVIEFYIRWKEGNPPGVFRWGRASVAVVAPLAGYLIYLGINYYVFGDFFASGKYMVSEWHKRIVPMPTGLNNLFATLEAFVPRNFSQIITDRPSEVLAIIVLAIFGLYAAFKARVSYAVFLAANLFIVTSTSWILSSPRYVAVMFPVAFLLAAFLAKKPSLCLGLAFLGIILQTYYIYLFATGHWAF